MVHKFLITKQISRHTLLRPLNGHLFFQILTNIDNISVHIFFYTKLIFQGQLILLIRSIFIQFQKLENPFIYSLFFALGVFKGVWVGFDFRRQIWNRQIVFKCLYLHLFSVLVSSYHLIFQVIFYWRQTLLLLLLLFFFALFFCFFVLLFQFFLLLELHFSFAVRGVVLLVQLLNFAQLLAYICVVIVIEFEFVLEHHFGLFLDFFQN
ncbi:hypothetical protein PPERSA_05654 [Pseudocohnilembus persalinus]|uniref:Transmembrane protein n=1 Tax=Pseudocohnilembus persalinus TaxID=266149 RepID=A0A0V0QQ59_PSEPJ|nr:hypothetical protein PPERSA_05654 [Pseudocohnilembus persalinus]|eukprot:KRX04393.1 hypothetical protein PPERSA_05654 [Pseudocohnilembus persalinus]